MEEFQDITYILGRLEGKMDSLLVAHGQLNERTADVETRVRTLENYRAAIVGASAVVSIVVSVIFKYLD